jgi:TPR repeat protein
MLLLGDAYRLGTNHEKIIDSSQANKWYTMAAERGNNEAMYELALYYENLEQWRDMISWLKKTYSTSQQLCERRKIQYAFNLKLSCMAASKLAYHFESNRQWKESFVWYNKIVTNVCSGSNHGVVFHTANAAYRLALLYCTGSGVTQSYKDARKWYHVAIEESNLVEGDTYVTNMGINARIALAKMYQDGIGVAQNTTIADKLYVEVATLRALEGK